ncbi:MAG: LD-carboxypeptidase, partial [Lachnospiraceae bacterium]|nr:LD-carboxypeptidase [Lachnospiraceae bacterium]
MIYPKWLNKGDLIGIPAPSAGIKEEKLPKFELSLSHVKKAGYRVRETDSVRSGLASSATPEVRGKEFMELITDDEVHMVLCAAGGDFLYDMLPYLDYESIRKHPKWIQGYSDPTGILFGVTTKLDIATIYGGNAGTFGMTKLHPSLQENLKLWKGELTEQNSYDKCEAGWVDNVDGYALTVPVEWKTPNGPVKMSGRLIGGCMDCLRDLIGTPYEDAAGFAKRYAADGLIWYFDVFSMPAEAVYLT